jgi:two-component system phosphate regulon sensor histidine kinase PhoR
MKRTPDILANQSISDILPTPLFFLDHDLCMLSWNPAAQKLFHLQPKYRGLPIQQLIGNTDFTLLQSDTSNRVTTTLTQAPYLDLSLSLLQYQDGQYLLVIEDITQIHHLERMRQDFVANVSHELRTPLTVFHGYLEMLLEQKKYPASACKKIFEQMYQQSVRMEKLIGDLLLLSRLESVAPEQQHFKPIAVAHLLEIICQDARAFSGTRQHTITLSADKNLTLYGLENELTSAFTNIIINAVNYTPARGHISIKWHQHNHQACLEVTDTGIGIEKKHIPRLTERFYRVDKARSRSSGGTGLGLAIVKHVLLLHKATLNISSEPESGSTFTCIFRRDLA